MRFVQAEAVQRQLEQGHVVLLSNLAYSAAGEVLNCNSYDVATHAAIELCADKFICILDGLADMQLPQWLPLNDAEHLIAERALVSRYRCLLLGKCSRSGVQFVILYCCQIASYHELVFPVQAAEENADTSTVCHLARHKAEKAVNGSVHELEFDLDW